MKEEWVEFDSFINIRPSQNNRSRDVENPKIRERIIDILISWLYMSNLVHVNSAMGKWRTLSLAEQLGNIGSEINRVLKVPREKPAAF